MGELQTGGQIAGVGWTDGGECTVLVESPSVYWEPMKRAHHHGQNTSIRSAIGMARHEDVLVFSWYMSHGYREIEEIPFRPTCSPVAPKYEEGASVFQ